ncbi:hypothetical protein [Streptomyces lunaelactis]|uniref:hypothetical protein n=1 Tax=Streptomyces lunaelactis TaxID=1535768 RepID=UPI0020C7762A|nr:hypothetical protein [Streptomyces lunaelactis]
MSASVSVALLDRSYGDERTYAAASIVKVSILDAMHERLGLTQTRAESAWGLTRTTARDQLTLMRAVFGGPTRISGP